MVKVAIVASVAATAVASSGHMSVLGGSVVDSKCEYAGSTHGGAKSTAATSPHVVSGRYCGVSEKMFAGGATCGACYKVSYSGEGGTNPGHAGSAVVQVVNQASEVFACHKDVFHTITGATTGIFPITYTEVACEVDSAVGVATVLDGNNAYYTKAIFSDLPHAVSSAKLKVGSKSFPMNRVAGATFMASTDGNGGSASFELTLADGSINKMAPCFSSWPVATDSSCAPAAVQLETSQECDTYSVKSDSDISGEMISEVSVESQEECCSQCSVNAKCEAWSYASQWSKCYLKSGFQGVFDNTGIVAGYPLRPTNTCSNYDVQMDTDVSGELVNEMSALTKEECCGKCDSTATCEAWSFAAQWSKCYFKKNFQGTFNNTGIVAGVKQAVV